MRPEKIDFNKTICSLPDNFKVVVFPEEDFCITGSLLKRNSAIFASWLQEQGLRTISIHIGNYPEFVYLFSGALRAGVKSVVLNALNKVESDVPVFDRETVADILEKRAAVPPVFKEYVWKMDEPLVVMSTSGTCGQRTMIEKSMRDFFGAKGIRFSWRFSIRLIRARLYNCAPWYHNTGMMLRLLSLSGVLGTEITEGKFNPEVMRRNLNKTHPGFSLSTPTMLLRCVKCGDVRLPRYNITFGETLSMETLHLLENKGGELLYNVYGTTEKGPFSRFFYVYENAGLRGKGISWILHAAGLGDFIFNRKTIKPFCTGRLQKTVKVKIVDENGETPGDGVPGEILVCKGPSKEYFATGDIGYVDEDGLLFVCGRKTSVINRSGEKILPGDIEKVVRDFPGVDSVLVFGIPSKTHGEDICLAIESHNGVSIGKSDLEGKLPRYMIPQHYSVWEQFPMNPSGKVDLNAIRTAAIENSR